MQDCHCHASNHTVDQRSRSAGWAALVAAAALLATGCLCAPDGRMLGAATFDRWVGQLHGQACGCGSNAPDCTACGSCPDDCHHPGCNGPFDRLCADDFNLLNLCAPAAAPGPPTPPPPGRFFPVPTRPVFAPRASLDPMPYDQGMQTFDSMPSMHDGPSIHDMAPGGALMGPGCETPSY